jgi:hypothetical protein
VATTETTSSLLAPSVTGYEVARQLRRRLGAIDAMMLSRKMDRAVERWIGLVEQTEQTETAAGSSEISV